MNDYQPLVHGVHALELGNYAHSVHVCVSVCHHTSCYIHVRIILYVYLIHVHNCVENKVPLL